MGIDDSIKLSEAPALLFAKVWPRIVSLKGGEEQALQALDHPDDAIFVISRRQFLEANRNDSEQRRAALAGAEAYPLISELISNLRNLGAEGRIIASGLYAGTGLRQWVPAELWPAAKIDFAACKLSSGTFVVYNYVTVKRSWRASRGEGPRRGPTRGWRLSVLAAEVTSLTVAAETQSRA